MKSIYLLALSIVFLSCKNQDKSADISVNTDNKELAATTKVETATFTVSGMSCQVMCANKIEKELASLKGVSKATVDFEKKLATVQYDSAQVSPEKLIEIVEAVSGGKIFKVSNLTTTANKAQLFQEKEKTRKEKRAARKAKLEADKAQASADATPATSKSCSTSGKKCCSKTAAATTL